MAEVDVARPTAAHEASLKRLEFLRSFTMNSWNSAWSIYDYAKESAGPFKGPVQTVENVVRHYSTPIIEKYDQYAPQILHDVDEKVDRAVAVVEQSRPVEAVRQLYGFHMDQMRHYSQAREEYIKRVEDGVERIVHAAAAQPAHVRAAVADRAAQITALLKEAREQGAHVRDFVAGQGVTVRTMVADRAGYAAAVLRGAGKQGQEAVAEGAARLRGATEQGQAAVAERAGHAKAVMRGVREQGVSGVVDNVRNMVQSQVLPAVEHRIAAAWEALAAIPGVHAAVETVRPTLVVAIDSYNATLLKLREMAANAAASQDDKAFPLGVRQARSLVFAVLQRLPVLPLPATIPPTDRAGKGVHEEERPKELAVHEEVGAQALSEAARPTAVVEEVEK
eukprot:jgi/Mesvir1/11695/Mv00087-RA.1